MFSQVSFHRGVSAPFHAGTPPRADTHLPWADTPLAQCMLGYGQQAGGTYPTGMHSCSSKAFKRNNYRVQVRESKRLPFLAIMKSAGITSDVNLRNPSHIGDKAHGLRVHTGFDTEGRHHQKSKNRSISGPTERTDVLQNLNKKLLCLH